MVYTFLSYTIVLTATKRNKNETKKEGMVRDMTLRKIHELGLISDNTVVWVRNPDMRVLAHGNWYQDHVLEYMDSELECFTWQDDNNFYIDPK